MTKLSKNFHDYEFFCPCGKCEAKKVSPILVAKLQLLRDRVGEPVYITSGVRCKTYNEKINGYSKSPHLDGLAADISGYLVLAYNAQHIDIVPPHPSKYWLVKKYGEKYIYSGNEKDLAKFLKNNL